MFERDRQISGAWLVSLVVFAALSSYLFEIAMTRRDKKRDHGELDLGRGGVEASKSKEDGSAGNEK